jgi:hypothetical protein
MSGSCLSRFGFGPPFDAPACDTEFCTRSDHGTNNGRERHSALAIISQLAFLRRQASISDMVQAHDTCGLGYKFSIRYLFSIPNFQSLSS